MNEKSFRQSRLGRTTSGSGYHLLAYLAEQLVKLRYDVVFSNTPEKSVVKVVSQFDEYEFEVELQEDYDGKLETVGEILDTLIEDGRIDPTSLPQLNGYMMWPRTVDHLRTELGSKRSKTIREYEPVVVLIEYQDLLSAVQHMEEKHGKERLAGSPHTDARFMFARAYHAIEYVEIIARFNPTFNSVPVLDNLAVQYRFLHEQLMAEKDAAAKKEGKK